MAARSAIEEPLRNTIRTSKISRPELAEIAGVSPSVITRFLNGDRSLTLPTADKLAAALGLELRPARKEKR